MTIISTLFPAEEMHKQTWIHPDGMTCHEIDHIHIERWATNILNIMLHRDACCVSDHYLVKTTLTH
jgi:endonuclease/exonuclease/phosphatase family metal-dependent hydrolase